MGNVILRTNAMLVCAFLSVINTRRPEEDKADYELLWSGGSKVRPGRAGVMRLIGHAETSQVRRIPCAA